MHDTSLTTDHGDRLGRLDARLRELAVGAARWRLALGEALERLGRAGGVRVLGFSSMAAYAVERCGYSGRWVEEARALSRRLAGLPMLKAALAVGRVTWSMAQLLGRHATPETEAELVAAGASMTLRAMRARLEPASGRTEEEQPPRRTVETVVSIEDAWAFERARMLVGAATDDASTDEVVEAMLAETMTSLLLAAGDGDALARDIDRAAHLATCRAEAQRVHIAARERIEAAFEPGLAPQPLAPAPPAADPVPANDDKDPHAIDREIVSICRELRGRDLAIGRLAQVVRDTVAWRDLGYASFAHFGRERLGLSMTALESKLALARRCDALPALGEAVQDGRIGQVGAMMLGRVARPDTAAAWVERAAERTVEDLREDVEVAGLLARTSGDPSRLAPPDEQSVAAVRAIERDVLAGVEDPGPHMSVAPGMPTAGKVPLRLTVASDLADFWMAVRALHARTDADQSFIATLSANIRRFWTPEPDRREHAEVYLRDRYRCASPVCRRRDVGAHHIVFRAHGGGDEPSNLVSLCGTCHIEGVHADHIRVTGRAPDALRWRIGRAIRVIGRRRVAPDR